MKIDYYCFPTNNGNLSPFMNFERYRSEEKKIYYKQTQSEILEAEAIGKLLLFDLRNNRFISKYGKKVDITGKIIFPRSNIADAEILLKSIEEKGGISIISLDDYNAINYWFTKVKTKREYIQTTLKEFKENLLYYQAKFGSNVFIKPIVKEFSDVCEIKTQIPIGPFKYLNEDMLKMINNLGFIVDSLNVDIEASIKDVNTEILVTKPVEIVMDDFGRREWRAFVVNNALVSLSRCSEKEIPIEKDVYRRVRSLIEKEKGKIPSSYVMDVFEYYKNGRIIFDILEYNPIIDSGRYNNNCIVF